MIKVKHRGSITNMRSYDNIYVLVTDFLFFFFFGLLYRMINRSLAGSPGLAGIMGRYHR